MKSLRPTSLPAAALLLSLLATQGALAADAPTVAAARQARFKQLGADFKAVNEAVRVSNWTPASMAAYARRVAAAAHDLPAWFPRGSGPDTAAKTKAKASIWSDEAGFRVAASALTTQADKLQFLINSNDAAAIPTQVQAVGRACASCHANFRQKD